MRKGVDRESFFLLKIIFIKISVTVIALLGVHYSHDVNAQQGSPNKLPSCPTPDYSKNDFRDQHAKWHNCIGSVTLNVGGTFVGEFRNAVPNGYGTINGADGTKYVGNWKDGLFNGRGTFTWPNGGNYIGEWENGEHSGYGVRTYPDGSVYRGEFAQSLPHGNGTFEYKNGAKYVGSFVRGMREGQGSQTEPDGRRYAGLWINDRPAENSANTNRFMDSLIGCTEIRNKCLQTGIYFKCMELQGGSCKP